MKRLAVIIALWLLTAGALVGAFKLAALAFGGPFLPTPIGARP